MSARVEHAEHSIEEVFDFFADAFEAPEGMRITRAIPHYDPRVGTVIFKLYLEPDAGSRTDPESPISDL